MFTKSGQENLPGRRICRHENHSLLEDAQLHEVERCKEQAQNVLQRMVEQKKAKEP